VKIANLKLKCIQTANPCFTKTTKSNI